MFLLSQGQSFKKMFQQARFFQMFLQKEQALQFLKDFILISFLWSLKNTMTILALEEKKKKNDLSFFVVIENLDQIVLKLSLMTGEGRQDVVPAGIVLLGRWNLSLISLSKISLISVWSVLVRSVWS